MFQTCQFERMLGKFDVYTEIVVVLFCKLNKKKKVFFCLTEYSNLFFQTSLRSVASFSYCFCLCLIHKKINVLELFQFVLLSNTNNANRMLNVIHGFFAECGFDIKLLNDNNRARTDLSVDWVLTKLDLWCIMNPLLFVFIKIHYMCPLKTDQAF